MSRSRRLCLRALLFGSVVAAALYGGSDLNLLAQDEDSETPSIYDTCVPNNLHEAVECLKKHPDQEGIKKFGDTPFDELGLYHMSLGLSIRNAWGLWAGDTALAKFFFNKGITHPDDMSGIILDSLWLSLNGCEYELEKQIRYYKAWWAASEKARQESDDNGYIMTGVPKPVFDCPAIEERREKTVQ